MSWIRGIVKTTSDSTEPKVSPRTAKRNKLQEERLQRARQRDRLKKQLKSVQEAKDAADLAEAELLALDPEIFEGTIEDIDVSEDILNESIGEAMAEAFEDENGTDAEKAMDKLGSIKVPFDKEDLEFWFSELEGQLEVIGVKSQWLKRIALQQFLPVEIRSEVKSLLKLTKANCGDDIYKRIKVKLMELFGQKPEDAYIRAKNRVMTGKPSQLGKLILEDLCDKDKKLDGCCCAKTVWGMYRENLPVVVRNHIAEMAFNKDTFKEVFTKSDQVFDSNRGPDNSAKQVAAVSDKSEKSVAAVQRSKNKSQRNKNQGGDQKSQSKDKDKDKKPVAKVNDEGLCRIHAKWKKDANFCAAPWACSMKDVWKSPQ